MALRSMVGATSPRIQLELLLGRILVPSQTSPASRTEVAAPQDQEGFPGTVGTVGGGAPNYQSPGGDAGHGSAGSGSGSGRASGAGDGQYDHERGGTYGAAQAKADHRAMCGSRRLFCAILALKWTILACCRMSVTL